MPPATVLPDDDFDGAFVPPSRAQWIESALAGLDPGSALDALEHQTLDGLIIRVLYDQYPDNAEQFETAAAPGQNKPEPSKDPDTAAPVSPAWDNRFCVHDTSDAAASNRMLLKSLRGGNTSLELHVNPGADVQQLLDGVMLDIAAVSLRAGEHYAALSPALLEVARQRSAATDKLPLSFNADPVGHWLVSGQIPDDMEARLSDMARFSMDMSRELPQASTLLVDGSMHHNAGASAAQELQAAISTGTLYLEAQLQAGMDIGRIGQSMVFQMACDADALLNVVKLRSLRILWQHVLLQYGDPASCAMQVVAETSRRYLSRLDPWNNHLRNVAACSAAALGGADTIIVHPHDRIDSWQSGEDPDIGLRMARNLPIILEREAGIRLVQDPMAGSYAVECLTRDLCDQTWQALAEMRDTRHWLSLIESGVWQAGIRDTHRRRLAMLQENRAVMVGVNRYSSSPGEGSAATADSASAAHALRPVRDAETFESVNAPGAPA